MQRTSATAERAVVVALAGAVAATACLSVFVRVASSSWARVDDVARADPSDVLLTGIAALGALGCLWLGSSTVIAALAELPGVLGAASDRVARTFVPSLVRRAVAVAVGSAIAAAAPMSASAYAASPVSWSAAALIPGDAPDPSLRPLGEPSSPLHAPVATQAAQATQAAPDPGFVPAPPSQPAPSATGIDALERTPRPSVDPRSIHVVQRGDTLWDIAAAHLGRGATPAQIAAAWPQWYAANRQTIGADPGHIVPGQQLIAPSSAPAGALVTVPATSDGPVVAGSEGGSR